MASASEKSPRGVGDLHTGMNEIEITGFASRTTDSSDANSEARFRGGHSHGLFASAAPAPRSPRRQEGPQDLVPSQAGLFARPAPEADRIDRPAPHHQDLSSTRTTSWFRLSSLVLSSLLGSRSHVFVCACCCSCSCKVVLEVKNANKIAAFGTEMLIRCEAHAEMIRSWQMDARPLKRARSCEGGHK